MLKALVICCFICVHSAPMKKPDATTYLKKYGYLPKGGGNNLTEALTKYQNFMGLPQTGKMDVKTVEMMRMPRCGFPDMGSENFGNRNKTHILESLKQKIGKYVLEGSKWNTNYLTYVVDQYSEKLHPRIVDKELREAFNLWLQHINMRIDQLPYGNADIHIGFYYGYHNDPYPFTGPLGTYAHAFYPSSGGDIHFDESEAWSSHTNRGINFKQVAVHEIGHALGLEHSTVRDAIMYPTFNGISVPNLQLHPDDVAGIQRLYNSYY